jgi:acid phosphatase family membrane protein YuiD
VDISYVITPFFTWLVAGTIKFVINSVKEKQLAFGQIGYGGIPSNHSAIVSSMAALIAFKEGIGHPAFGVSITIAFIVMLDANSLRRQVGKHAQAINRLSEKQTHGNRLRERMGHTRMEILTGVGVGVACAWTIYFLSAR